MDEMIDIPGWGLEDLALEHLYEEENDNIEYVAVPAWRTKNNDLIPIRDMATSHIQNCINMIHRSNDTWRPEYLPYLKDELIKRKYDKTISDTQYKKIAEILLKWNIEQVYDEPNEECQEPLYPIKVTGIEAFICVDYKYAYIPSISKEEARVLNEILTIYKSEKV